MQQLLTQRPHVLPQFYYPAIFFECSHIIWRRDTRYHNSFCRRSVNETVSVQHYAHMRHPVRILTCGEENQIAGLDIFFPYGPRKFSLLRGIARQHNSGHISVYSQHHARTVGAASLVAVSIRIGSAHPVHGLVDDHFLYFREVFDLNMGVCRARCLLISFMRSARP